jgi:tricorn protease
VEAASPKYSILYFLSEKGGSQNVWRRSFNGKDAPVQITKHEMHPVRFLSCSSGGDLVYGYDGEIWRLPKGADEPKRVEVKISQGSLLDGPFYASVTSDISELAVSQDGRNLPSWRGARSLW